MTRSILMLGLAGICLFACDDSSATSPAGALKSPSSDAALDRHANPAIETTRDSKILAFETMYGVDDAFVDSKEIRRVQGDELPWEVGSAAGFLTVGGHLKVSVRGIVFTHDEEVPPELRGINDEETFRALVSCLISENRKIRTVNIATEPFPATRSGDSDIDAHVHLPEDCVAPIIFILSGSEDHWFAVTGAETS